MKIGIVIRCCRAHGSSRYALEVTREFAERNDVHVYTNNWDPLDPRVTVHKIPTISDKFYVYEASFLAFSSLIMKTQKMDVTMAQPTRYFTPDVGYMQFVYRHWANYKKQNGMRVDLADRILPAIEGANVKKVKKIITMSKVLKEEVIKNYGIPTDKIRVIYSGVNTKEFSPEHRKTWMEPVRKNLGIDDNDVVLLFVGNPYARKGLSYLIEALPKIEDRSVKLLVMGRDLGEDKIENYQLLARKLGVEKRLVYGGFSNEVFKYFAASDIFAFPTLYEPFGLVVTEAMASGLPVVVSAAAGSAELVEDGKNGMLIQNPKSPDEIAEKINHLINNSLYRKMGNAARKTAESLTWKKTADQMLEVFEEVRKR